AYNVNFPHYSDGKMEAHFLSNEADFNRLVEMFKEDAEVDMIIGDEAYALKETGKTVSRERLEQYKTLFDKTKVNHGIRRNQYTDPQEIILVSTYYSSETDGNGQYQMSSKGFIYSPTEPAETDGSSKYKKIKENWYLYYFEGTGKLE
ncbi:MAG TPA: hypothetical protein VEQ34_12685, partial [Pyrinomonadaceae bacterium]|nr:hypothetical protein [Pyrinomonadaceae bacterium]